MSATVDSNQSFGGVAPSGRARLSTQEVWQSISGMAGQVRALADLNAYLHNALNATLASTSWVVEAGFWVGGVETVGFKEESG